MLNRGKTMRASLIKCEDNTYRIFLKNGTIAPATTIFLKMFLTNFQNIETTEGSLGRWDEEYLDLALVPGKIYAYITDDNSLVIKSFEPFDILFLDEDIKKNRAEDFLSVNEYAKRVGKSVEQVKCYLRDGRIPDSRKIGRDWIIHRDSVLFYPTDRRRRP